MKILPTELADAGNGNLYDTGYRLVYFNNENYSLGAYCKTIGGFMLGFAECYPIIDENDIPPFISTDDILNRSLDLFEDITAVAIYNINGECIAIKGRNKNNIK